MVTDYAEIAKDASALKAPPNLDDYEKIRARAGHGTRFAKSSTCRAAW